MNKNSKQALSNADTVSTDLERLYMLQEHAIAADRLIDPIEGPKLHTAVQNLLVRLKYEIEEAETGIAPFSQSSPA